MERVAQIEAMNPLQQPIPHRVYIHASHYCDRWFVQYLEQDLKTPIGRMYRYSRIDHPGACRMFP